MTKDFGQIPEMYDGREQALIKHRLLASYLEKLVLVIGMGARRTGNVELAYVDCFAGPWGDSSESLDGTSIAISLRTLATCRKKLAELGVTASIRALYIEKDRPAFTRLSTYLQHSTPEDLTADCMPGDFVDLREEILRWCGSAAFVFFFIDPKGWKAVGIETLRPLLQRPRSEFLITFVYDFINRTASMNEWQDEVTELLGSPVDLAGLSPQKREKTLLDTYRRGLKQAVAAARPQYQPRTAYVRVMDPTRERPKYHLVYVTSHPVGVIEFMEVSQGVDLIQRRVRAMKRVDARKKQTGMTDMFADEAARDVEVGTSSQSNVDAFWLSRLSRGIQAVGLTEFADILEETDWMPAELQASLARLIKGGRVRNVDAPGTRPKKPLHPERNERLELVVKS